MTVLRSELQTLLESILGSGNVYFQPGKNVTLEYPCIVYNLDELNVRRADNNPYNKFKRYRVVVISRDPDNNLVDLISDLPMCDFSTHFTTDHLNHYVFALYF